MNNIYRFVLWSLLWVISTLLVSYLITPIETPADRMFFMQIFTGICAVGSYILTFGWNDK